MPLPDLDPSTDADSELPSSPAVRRLRTALLVCGAALLAILWWTGALHELTHPERIRHLVDEAGPAAPLAFVVLLIPLNLVFLAGAPIWISATLWPLPLAILYSTAGTVAASASAYVLGRHLGNRWSGARIPRRLHRFEKQLDRRPVRAILALRLLLWINPGVDLLIAAARVPWRDYLLGTVLGMVFPTALRVIVGSVGIEALTASTASGTTAWPWLIAAAAGVVLVAFLRQRRLARLAADDMRDPNEAEDLSLAAAEER